jgi:hypothetical protein
MADKKEVAERDDNGRFLTSGNPKGRPKGSKNRVTLLKLMAEESIREDNTDQMMNVARLVIAQALDGDTKSQKLVWDSVMSKGTADEKTQAREKVEINIGGMTPPEVKTVTEITIDQEEDPQDDKT